jgi:hypothetical protein
MPYPWASGDILSAAELDAAFSARVLKAGDTVTGALGFSGAGVLQLPSWTSAPSTAAGVVGYNTTSGRYEFGIGASVVNHVRLSGDTMTGALTINANLSVSLTPGTGRVNIANLPTSNVGLNPGDLWNNGGVVCIA